MVCYSRFIIILAFAISRVNLGASTQKHFHYEYFSLIWCHNKRSSTGRECMLWVIHVLLAHLFDICMHSITLIVLTAEENRASLAIPLLDLQDKKVVRAKHHPCHLIWLLRKVWFLLLLATIDAFHAVCLPVFVEARDLHLRPVPWGIWLAINYEFGNCR